VTGTDVLDFTSASYLGLRHPQRALRPWSRLTTGVPAALAEPGSARALAARIAGVVGTERAVLAASTLHAFWDLFVTLGADRLACYVDAGAYPIADWGVERAAGRGAQVRRFPHQNADALGRLLRAQAGRAGRLAVVVTDGVCAGCGQPAPLRRYLAALRPLGGLLVIDDTQALGVFGRDATRHPPYGRGGGGSLRRAELTSPDVLVVSSLAKAFGVPVAVIAGEARLIERYERHSETRVHCSPPSIAHLRAAEHALEVNLRQGEQRRARLAALVRRLQDGVAALGYRIGPAQFPVQALGPVEGVPPALLYRRLLELRVRAVLHRPACRPVPTCSFLITASHTPGQVDRLLTALGHALAGPAAAAGPGRQPSFAGPSVLGARR
jgi:8-amino-7-oxononanoate synthase